jgi:putative transposase
VQVKNIRWRNWPRLIGLGPELSRAGGQRLKWMDFYARQGGNACLTCRRFGISRPTLYRWLERFDPGDLRTLEERSHRPRRVRKPTWSPELLEATRTLRVRYPRWGKDKLVVLLGQEGWEVSTSMVGRMLGWLKRRGLLHEPPRRGISARKRFRLRPYAVRKPNNYAVQQPGDLVEIDTLDVRPYPKIVRKHLTARDVISRWDVIAAFDRITSRATSGFIDSVRARMPFPIRAFQVDGGSEFAAEFERECQKRGIRLFVLPPRSPELNGHVERAQRTHTEEFYEVQHPSLDIPTLNRQLQAWEIVYNTIRPHQSLGQITPLQFLQGRRIPPSRPGV